MRSRGCPDDLVTAVANSLKRQWGGLMIVIAVSGKRKGHREIVLSQLCCIAVLKSSVGSSVSYVQWLSKPRRIGKRYVKSK